MKIQIVTCVISSLLASHAAFAASANTKRVLVALEAGGAVLLDGSSGEVLQKYNTGPNAFGALFSQDGKRAFVTDKDKGTLSEVDQVSGDIIQSVVVGNLPQQPAMTSEG